MPGKSGTAARHPTPRFALVILSGAHRLDSGRPSLPDWSTQVDPKQSSSRGALNAYCCHFSVIGRATQAAASHSLRHANLITLREISEGEEGFISTAIATPSKEHMGKSWSPDFKSASGAVELGAADLRFKTTPRWRVAAMK
jgi:hypothetical protein